MNALSRRALPLAAIAVLLSLAPARAELMYGTTGSVLSRFDSNNLGSVTSVPLTGMQAGETLVGIDLRPANGLLYGVGSSNRLYTINPLTGQATQVGSAGAFAVNGTSFGTDFNPVPDRIRQVSNTEQNLRLNPNDGTLTALDSALNPAGNVVAVAYSNNFAGAASTVLYAIDSAAGTLGIITNPNAGGPITVVGSLGLGTNLNEAIGFDISGSSGLAFASITTGGLSRLYTINLATGAATLASSNGGAIGTGTAPFLGLTAATAVPEPSTYMLLGAGALLVFFYSRRRRAASN
ncbi:MAG TPA: DUF4394 domain-containing protein [Chthoniobacterales bacterium]